MSEWTEEKINLLKELWPTSLRTRDIAERLGRMFTKGSIIGKARRIGLPPKTKRKSRVLKGSPKTPRLWAPKRPPIADPVPVAPMLPLDYADAVNFADLQPYHCKAIVGKAQDSYGLNLSCGRQVKEGSAFEFCDHHMAIYTQLPIRRR